MTAEIQNYQQKIEALLANYTDGRDVFKVAKDWTHAVKFKEGVNPQGLPTTWIELVDRVIGIIAHDKYQLKTYPNTIEIITAQQMLEAYAHNGLPIGYDHWSVGLQRVQEENAYHKGKMGLAYEIVINTNPAIAYCMEQNTKTLQMLVIAHASYGHNSFFRNNYLFLQNTDAKEIIPRLIELKEKVRKAEELYGYDEVEKLLDACHALQYHAVDHYTKPAPLTADEIEQRRREAEKRRQKNFDITIEPPIHLRQKFEKKANDNREDERIPQERDENILKFIATYSPVLKPWQREIMLDICYKSQYFYPQMQTQVMNEGWASFWHYTLMYDLSDMNLIDDGMMLEFFNSHGGVLYQRPEAQFNPYRLGINIFQDIKRMCENPTAEDKQWFPDIVGKPWLPTLKFAMENFKDESFILQYLSPKVIRDMKMFSILDQDSEYYVEVSAIQNEDGYRKIREVLAAQYRLSEKLPQVEIERYNYKSDRKLILRHTMTNGRPLHEEDTSEVLKHIHRLWGHPVILQTRDHKSEVVSAIGCPPLPSESKQKSLFGP